MSSKSITVRFGDEVIEAGCMTPQELRELKTRVEEVIDDITWQLERAYKNAESFGLQTDEDWLHRARDAKKWKELERDMLDRQIEKLERENEVEDSDNGFSLQSELSKGMWRIHKERGVTKSEARHMAAAEIGLAMDPPMTGEEVMSMAMSSLGGSRARWDKHTKDEKGVGFMIYEDGTPDHNEALYRKVLADMKKMKPGQYAVLYDSDLSKLVTIRNMITEAADELGWGGEEGNQPNRRTYIQDAERGGHKLKVWRYR